ncbi:hypothetical protein FRB97_007449 [Tulasnella sp. 331]|nr:hypothetical protein FRB97_007449 [Tulasnella sp. 331]
MTRHPTHPIAFIQFHNVGAAKKALQILGETPLIVQGRTLRIAYADPIAPHPNDRPLGRAKRKMSIIDEASRKPSERPVLSPSKALYIRYATTWWEVHPIGLRAIISKMEGFRTMRFRRTVHTMGFVEFDSVEHATAAMESLMTRDDLGDIRASYANPKIERQETKVLHLLVVRKTPLELREVNKVFGHLRGFIQTNHLVASWDPAARHVLIAFDSVKNASAAQRQVQEGLSSRTRTPSTPLLKGLVEVSFYDGCNPNQNIRASAPSPSNELLINGVTTQDGLRHLLRSYPGFQKLLIGNVNASESAKPRAPGFKDTYRLAGWAIAQFNTIEDAKVAREALHQKLWKTKILDVQFQRPEEVRDETPRSVQTIHTNVLFAKDVFGASQQEFHDAFAARFQRPGGYHSAVLYPDGRGGFMPYGKVMFDTPHAAKEALKALEVTPMRVGNGGSNAGSSLVLLETLRPIGKKFGIIIRKAIEGVSA